MRVNLGTYENQEAILNKQNSLATKANQTTIINNQTSIKNNQTTIKNNQSTLKSGQTNIINTQNEIKSLINKQSSVVKSVQRGVFRVDFSDYSTKTKLASINPIIASKSILIASQARTEPTSTFSMQSEGVAFLNSKYLMLENDGIYIVSNTSKKSSFSDRIVAWQVIEFY